MKEGFVMNQQKSDFPLPGFTGIGVTKRSNGIIVILRIGVTPEQYLLLSDEIKSVLWIPDTEKEEVNRFIGLSEQDRAYYLSYALLKHLEQFGTEGLNKERLEKALHYLESSKEF